MDLYNPHMVPQTSLQGNYDFPRSTNKIQFFLDKISTSEKIYQYNEESKYEQYEHQSIFPWVGGGMGGVLVRSEVSGRVGGVAEGVVGMVVFLDWKF